LRYVEKAAIEDFLSCGVLQHIYWQNCIEIFENLFAIAVREKDGMFEAAAS